MMVAREHLILSATEPDRPGLVAELTGFIAAHGCNVEDSRVAVLGGYAGLMFLISGDRAQVAALEGGLDALERSTGLRVVARRVRSRPAATAASPSAPAFVVTARAIDHVGIIHAITDAVRAHGGNVLELETTTESAPMSGAPLFALRMVVTLAPSRGSPAELREALEAMAQAEAIDLDMQPATERTAERYPALRLI
jgi:glycine cleavage system transcriptional repressor